MMLMIPVNFMAQKGMQKDNARTKRKMMMMRLATVTRILALSLKLLMY